MRKLEKIGKEFERMEQIPNCFGKSFKRILKKIQKEFEENSERLRKKFKENFERVGKRSERI